MLALNICASEQFNDLIAVAERERSILISYGLYRPTYVLDPNEREIISGKTFTELRDNAHRNHVPWIFRPIRITYPNKPPLIKLIDVVETLKTSHMYLCTNFSSHEAVDDSFLKALRICLPKEYYGAESLYTFEYHCIWPSTNLGYTTFLCHCMGKQGKQIIYSDVSCSLAMVFGNNYTQLLPLLHSLSKFSDKNPTKKFWYKTYQELSLQQKTMLQQIFVTQFYT